MPYGNGGRLTPTYLILPDGLELAEACPNVPSVRVGVSMPSGDYAFRAILSLPKRFSRLLGTPILGKALRSSTVPRIDARGMPYGGFLGSDPASEGRERVYSVSMTQGLTLYLRVRLRVREALIGLSIGHFILQKIPRKFFKKKIQNFFDFWIGGGGHRGLSGGHLSGAF